VLTVTFDTKEFTKTFRAKVAQSSRSLTDNVNGAALSIMRHALLKTRRADKAAIEALGVIYQTHGKRGKLLKKRRGIYAPTIRFIGIFLGNLKKLGLSGRSFPNRAALEAAAKKALAKRMSSIGFLASGWLPAARVLARALKERFDTGGIRQRGKDRGRGVAAKPGVWNPTAIMANSSFQTRNQSGESRERANAFIQSGLKEAFVAEIAKMRQHIIDKLNGVWRR
jgi:hypothetical protein